MNKHGNTLNGPFVHFDGLSGWTEAQDYLLPDRGNLYPTLEEPNKFSSLVMEASSFVGFSLDIFGEYTVTDSAVPDDDFMQLDPFQFFSERLGQADYS